MCFERYHPGILFLYFTILILGAICFQHPVFLVLSFVTSYLCSAFLGNKRSAVLHLCYIPLIFLFACYYAMGHHFGMTNLRRNAVGNYITLESCAYGLSLGIRTASVFMWLSCVHSVMTTDKIVYLFGRVSPRLSLYIAVLLRFVPRIKERTVQTGESCKCIGLGVHTGNPVLRLKHVLRIGKAVFYYTLEYMKDNVDSMKSRGYSLKGRTAFSIFRFDNRDRMLVIWIFLLSTVIWAGEALEQNRILYDPVILMHKITPWSFLFYSVYLLIGVLPIGIEFQHWIKKNIKRDKIHK